jgi:hypothetical protein
MLNFQPELTADRALQVNQNSIERHINDDHYVRGFTPGDFVLTSAVGAAFVLDNVGARWPLIEMPDAGISRARVSWRKPSEWRSGKLSVTMWYTSTVGSTNNFHLIYAIDAIRAAEVIFGTELLLLEFNAPGPAVANTVMKVAATYSTVSLGSDDELFAFGIARDGANADDTNVNSIRIIYATIEHIPERQVSQ